MPVTRRFGSATVHALTDAVSSFFRSREAAFPQAGDGEWSLADRLDPGARDTDGGWRLQFRCYLVMPSHGRPVLVDAGVGPVGAVPASWAGVPGALPEELGVVGVDPHDVGAVVLTHLHTDHVGWAVLDARPYFPNARYLLQRAEADAVGELNPPLRRHLIEPLRRTGQLHLVDGEYALGGGLRLIPTPGHTPGHQSALLDTGDELLAITGDLIVHAVQWLRPDLPFALDADAEMATASRASVLDLLAGRTACLATSHLTEPFVPPAPAGCH